MGHPCGDGKYRVPWRNCVSPQRLHLPVHHQYAILPLSTNMKATSAPARSRCCKSYWLSGKKIRLRQLALNSLPATTGWRDANKVFGAWPKKVFHQLYQDDILIFVMRRLEQSRVYATSQQGQSLQLQYLWTGFFRFSVNLQDLKFYAHRT